MASSTGPRRRRGAPEPRTFEGPETGRPRDAGSPEQELRAERARRPPPTHAQCREEMYQARPLSRNLFLYTFLQNHGPGFLDDQGEGLPGVTNILEFHPVSPYSDGPHYLAMQLASIADEMELRLLLPQFVEPIRMTVYRFSEPHRIAQVGTERPYHKRPGCKLTRSLGLRGGSLPLRSPGLSEHGSSSPGPASGPVGSGALPWVRLWDASPDP
ncbi:bcl-2-interacting killer isoform X3 [Phocoena sinus]|uniref:bcl-2-interacting killer isoform X3 n=1 Tax=Phocoena sinus TaxID=42100 RepID=UPI0013C45C81|nr:bcl-2-interacting killer isoform X3 [Phocoena sinus]